MATAYGVLTAAEKSIAIGKTIKSGMLGNNDYTDNGVQLNLDVGRNALTLISGIPITARQVEEIKRVLQARNLMDFTGIAPKADVNDNILAGMFETDGTVGTLTDDRIVGGFNADARRELGFLREEEKADRMLTAVSDPKQFLEQEQRNRKAINTRALNTYNEAYDQYIIRGFPKEQAHEKAVVAAKSFRGKLMEQHDIDYKGDFVDKVRTSLLVKR